MGDYLSATQFSGKMFIETITGSGSYNESSFTPTVFTFDIDPDTANLINIQVAQAGTQLIAVEDNRNRFISAEASGTWGLKFNGTYSLTYGQRYYLQLGNSPSPDQDWFAGGPHIFHDPLVNQAVYIGAYYNPDIDITYLFYAGKYQSSPNTWTIGYFKNVRGDYWSNSNYLSTKEWIIDYFYGGASPEDYKLVRISPAENKFAVGQSSQLSYELQTSGGVALEASITIEPDSIGTGWNFTPPNTLACITGFNSSSVKIIAVYEGNTFNKVETFTGQASGNPYGPGGSNGPSGGGGAFGGGFFGQPPLSDPIGNDVPNGSVENDPAAQGLYTRYLLTGNQLGLLGDYLFTNSLAITLIKELISVFYGSPIQSIINVTSYPFNVASMTGIDIRTTTIHWGNRDTSIAGAKLMKPAVYIDWGSLPIEPYWNNFLDYSPHTKVELYLPWCTGIVPIDVNECMGGSISVKTSIELDKGTCLHSVIVTTKYGIPVVTGTYEGVCGRSVPLSSIDTSGKAIRLATSAVGAIVSAASAAGSSALAHTGKGNLAKHKAVKKGNPPTPGAHLPYGRYALEQFAASKSLSKTSKRAAMLASASALAVFRTPASVSRNGSFSGNSQSMSIQYPYIILSRPTQSVPEEYGHHYGYPSNIYTSLGSLKGYTEVGTIHLNGIVATEEELDEIDNILKDGVIF